MTPLVVLYIRFRLVNVNSVWAYKLASIADRIVELQESGRVSPLAGAEVDIGTDNHVR
jgi:hypothetical protein